MSHLRPPLFCLHPGLRTLRQALATSVLALAAGWLSTLPAAAADGPYARALRLLDSGDVSAAQQQIQAHLAEHPKDPQMRFIQGVWQTRHNDKAAAMNTFTQLTQEFPELPEPYNNLAVLHAEKGQLDQALAALNMAVRLNPGYATAYRNLGDLHARLAADAYQRSLQIQPDQPGLSGRLQQLSTLIQQP